MLRSKGLVGVAGVSLAASVAVLVSCLSDPREGEAVSVVASCDLTKLSTSPTSPQSSLLAFAQAAELLSQSTTAAEAELRDACNAITADMGLPPGADVASACKPIAAKADEVSKPGGRPPPGGPHFVDILYAPNCTAAPKALEECLSGCAGPCDSTKCDQPQQAGTCAGDCTGQCITTGTDIPCRGQCVGELPIKGAPQFCNGECAGICTGVPFVGECGGACVKQFTGNCAGTCTGLCNGNPINELDAGVSDAGDAEAGPPPSGAPPSNPPGNCKGFCVGMCSSGSNGACYGAPCLDFADAGGPPGLAAFTGGNCYAFSGQCAGTCVSALGSGALSTCTGECTAVKKACDGVCVGGCTGTLSNTTCTGELRCGQNSECSNACHATALLKTVCAEPKSIEVYAVTDPAFGAILKKGAPRLGKVVTRLASLREAVGFISSRAYGDFIALGVQGDLARTCVAEANDKIAAAEAKVKLLISLEPSVRKVQQ